MGIALIEHDTRGPLLRLDGAWSLREARAIAGQIEALRQRPARTIDGSALERIDTAGRALLLRVLRVARTRPRSPRGRRDAR